MTFVAVPAVARIETGLMSLSAMFEACGAPGNHITIDHDLGNIIDASLTVSAHVLHVTRAA